MRARSSSSSCLSLALAAAALSTGALLLACSSATSGGPITGSYEPPDQAGSGSGSGSSSGGGSSSGSSSGGSSSGSSSGGGAAGSSSGGGASSGSDAGGAPVTASTTWTDGMTISAPVTIAPGVTITIANGATITVASGATITVQGTLVATTGTTHAKLTGSSWPGIVVATGGTLTADSLDITGAATPIDVTGTATYANGTITGATTPIDVETGGTLTMTSANVAGSLGVSKINGAFTASHLDYDSNGAEGVVIADAASVVKIDNSTFHGPNDVGADMITSNACASLTMTYTAITGCHCAYHFNEITSFDLENMDLHGDSYGFMAYGSNATSGTRVFKNSNVETMAAAGIDESGTNGAITVSGVYFDSSSKLALTDQEITVTAPASAALPATSVGPQ